MEELKEIRFNENNIQLKNNLVKGSILPEKIIELNRNITIQGNSVIEGAVYAHKLEIQNGNTEIRGAVFTQLEMYVNSEAKGDIIFKKSVGSANSIVSRSPGCNLMFNSDINAKSVTLYNAFVAGSIYADEIILQNCVVIGGVFATQNIEITNSITGTFNSPLVKAAQNIWLLLPSAFTIEKIIIIPGTKFYNLSLADLGSLYKGSPESVNSGKIEINIDTDEVVTVLTDGEMQKTIRSYTVIGKVLAADLLNMEKFQNHFLLTAASLGSQLLKNYDLGVNEKGELVPITLEKIKSFFFDILFGKIDIQEINGKFDISDITGKFNIQAENITKTESVYTGTINLLLKDIGPNKAKVIRIIRDINRIDATKTMKMIEILPAIIAKNLSEENASALMKELINAGAKVGLTDSKSVEQEESKLQPGTSSLVNVVLKEIGSNKSLVIRTIRNFNKIDASKTMKMIEVLPAIIANKLPEENAKTFMKELTDAGAIVELNNYN